MRSLTVVLAYEPHEWELLTKLPARIMIATTSDSRSVDAGLAGINAIAAGSDSESPLVRAVVSAIYSESDATTPTTSSLPDVLISCRAAALVLESRAEPQDASAYRDWMESIAIAVAGQEKGMRTDLAQALRNA